MTAAVVAPSITRGELEELIRSSDPIPTELREVVRNHPDFMAVVTAEQKAYADACRADIPFEEFMGDDLVSLDELLDQGYEV
jgi:hypothetical protein